MEPIRVLNLFTIMNRGGAETMVMNYYRKINREKVQFDFLVHREEEGAYEKEIKELGGRIYRMPPIYPQNFSLYKKKIREFFEEHKEYKIIHSHMSELGYFALREAKRQGIPVRICHAHNAPQGFEWKMLVRNYFKKKMMPYLTHMFMCGKESGDWLYGKQNEDKFIQLNNAIDAEKFRYNAKTEEEVRRKLNLENKFVIGHIGRFNKQKNHIFLIDIFYEISKISKNAQLVLIGTGNLQNDIIKKVERMNLSERVHFLGVRDDINEIIQCFDALLFPSLFEGLGIVLIEAQAAGVPCFTSKDVVAKEAGITSLCHYISLESRASQWAKYLLENLEEKKDRYKEIEEAGYDLKQNTKWLEEFYIDAARD